MNELPVGRRVAHWRVRRNMTQQQFADRLGKSKSWVDKVERGVRRLERVSSLREVAEALRIDLEMLLADRAAPADRAAAGVARGVEGIRAALARYHVPVPARPPDVAQVRARLGHAEQSYRHARYPELLALLPGLLATAREARRRCGPGRRRPAGVRVRAGRAGAREGRPGGAGMAGRRPGAGRRHGLRRPVAGRRRCVRPCGRVAGCGRRWRRRSWPPTASGRPGPVPRPPTARLCAGRC
ncbi:helix-turn-helix domain-containing protein [Micromonospora haikouensis]|uniref:helix-turn-helix domain-containing protein n=1 Tax=Micromonospora haikouensis TaxID=686309 RepID=UPI003D750CAF